MAEEAKKDQPEAQETDAAKRKREAKEAAEELAKKNAPTLIEQKVGIPGLAIGRIVHFHKLIEDNGGRNKMKRFAALILDVAAGASNFQPKDGAVDLKVFTSAKGGADEVRHGVMYSEKPAANRWSFPDKV